ncbi:MAG: hypothetical protein ACM3KR_04185 [Deltaproteobacteria bacterium]
MIIFKLSFLAIVLILICILEIKRNPDIMKKKEIITVCIMSVIAFLLGCYQLIYSFGYSISEMVIRVFGIGG